MDASLEDVIALEILETKLRLILPALYIDSYEDVQPISMGSAALKFGIDGKVAWDEMWGSFCDLAMAGGPPHRGTLLEPAAEDEIAAAPAKYETITQEICRGISMVTGLPVEQASVPGWVAVQCGNAGMAGWLMRAIVMENVMAGHEKKMLYLPAGPEFRLIKEVKNVVTVIAKTCHYWVEHMNEDQQQSINAMFSNVTPEAQLLEPASSAEVRSQPDAYEKVIERITQDIGQRMGLPCFTHRYAGWIGIECKSVGAAIWLMRAMIVENVLARREQEVIFLPVSPKFADGKQCDRLVDVFTRLHHLSVTFSSRVTGNSLQV
jgi:sirohydrochlorin cobaltochelatase